MVIYKVTNIENNKVYIGKTNRELKKRIWAHYESVRRGSETNFHNALRKYSKDKFEWEVIATANNNEELDTLEVHFIKEYNSFKDGYNMTEGGDGGLTYKKGTEMYNRIKHKLGKWKNGNPGSTPEAIAKRLDTFSKKTNWSSGEKHGNYGHRHNVGILVGEKNPMAKKVEVDGIIYETIASAAKSNKLSEGTMRYRLKSKNFKNYKYV